MLGFCCSPTLSPVMNPCVCLTQGILFHSSRGKLSFPNTLWLNQLIQLVTRNCTIQFCLYFLRSVCLAAPVKLIFQVPVNILINTSCCCSYKLMQESLLQGSIYQAGYFCLNKVTQKNVTNMLKSTNVIWQLKTSFFHKTLQSDVETNQKDLESLNYFPVFNSNTDLWQTCTNTARWWAVQSSAYKSNLTPG